MCYVVIREKLLKWLYGVKVNTSNTDVLQRIGALELQFVEQDTTNAVLRTQLKRLQSSVSRELYDERLHAADTEEEEEEDNEYVTILKQVGIDTPEKLEAAIAKIKGGGLNEAEQETWL